jgi:hypothetical protein
MHGTSSIKRPATAKTHSYKKKDDVSFDTLAFTVRILKLPIRIQNASHIRELGDRIRTIDYIHSVALDNFD